MLKKLLFQENPSNSILSTKVKMESWFEWKRCKRYRERINKLFTLQRIFISLRFQNDHQAKSEMFPKYSKIQRRCRFLSKAGWQENNNKNSRLWVQCLFAYVTTKIFWFNESSTFSPWIFIWFNKRRFNWIAVLLL